MAAKIKKGDRVVVLAGRDLGRSGEVIEVRPTEDRAVVENGHMRVRKMMSLTLSCDHRVVDGQLGGSFVRRVADYLESFDPNRTID